MSRPNVYEVRPGKETDLEPNHGWYWQDDEDEVRGPYNSRWDAIAAVDTYMWSQGLLEDGSKP